MEITSKVEAVIAHYKDSELVAITHSNGHSELMKTSSMTRKEQEDFYEANTTQGV